MQLTFLGTGTSAGVPLIGCSCSVCTSGNRKDRRLRSSVLISSEESQIVVDTGPDFRYQMLRENVSQLDAVLFTHEHRDHVAGLDDTRPFFFWTGEGMKLYCDEAVEKAIKRDFYYAFQENVYPGSPKFELNRVVENKSFRVGDIPVQPFQVIHGKLPILAYKFSNLAYITDANYIGTSQKELLKGIDHLIINALRIEEHHSHYNLEQALELVNELGAKNTYFTHISHQLGSHDEISAQLPDNVQLAYDGLQISFN